MTPTSPSRAEADPGYVFRIQNPRDPNEVVYTTVLEATNAALVARNAFVAGILTHPKKSIIARYRRDIQDVPVEIAPQSANLKWIQRTAWMDATLEDARIEIQRRAASPYPDSEAQVIDALLSAGAR